MTIYVYKEYNEDSCPNVVIKVFADKDKAITELKARVSEHFERPFDAIPKDDVLFNPKEDFLSDTYVKL